MRQADQPPLLGKLGFQLLHPAPLIVRHRHDRLLENTQAVHQLVRRADYPCTGPQTTSEHERQIQRRHLVHLDATGEVHSLW